MKGKKVIQRFKALKEIKGITIVNCVYETEVMKKNFPYIDFSNKDYFEEIFDSDKFHLGDNVEYVGSPNVWCKNCKIKKECEYKIIHVIHTMKNGLLYTTYQIIPVKSDKSDDSDYGATFQVDECDLRYIQEKWIVGFTASKEQSHPAIHKLDFFSWKKNISNTWKDIFVFDTFKEAESCAEMFANNDMSKMIKIFKNGTSV